MVKAKGSPHKIPRRYVIAGSLLILLGVGGAWYWSHPDSPDYDTLVMKPQTLVSTVDVSGIVESERKVTLKAAVSTQIAGRRVTENQRVAQGTPLLAIDNANYRLQVDQAQVQRNTSESQAQTELKLARQALETAQTQARYNQVNLNNQWQKAEENLFFLQREQARNARLYQQKVIPAQTYQQAQQQLEQARLDVQNAKNRLEQAIQNNPEIVNARQRVTQAQTALDIAQKQGRINVALPQENLRQSQVLAPFTGSVTRWLVNRGDYAAPATPLAEFQDLQDVRLVLGLNELDLPRVRKGATVQITFDAYPDTPYTGSVVAISEASVSDNESVQTYPARVWFANPGFKIKPGMSGDAQIQATRKSDVLAVPLSAVERKDDAFKVKVLTADQKVEERTVQVGLSTLEQIEITEGLQAGDQVILGLKSTP